MGEPSLPILDCHGCGVCCFHMGYPAYVLPREPMTPEQIQADSALVEQIAKDPKLEADLLAGRAGESHWINLPDDLRQQWQAYVDSYQLPSYGDDVSTFDGPCIWLDPETRLCQNHQHRPNICRDFETGSPDCLQWRRHYEDEIKPTPV